MMFALTKGPHTAGLPQDDVNFEVNSLGSLPGG